MNLKEGDACDGKCTWCIARRCCSNAYRKKHKFVRNEVFHQADINAEMQYHKDIENAFKMGFKLGLKAQKGE